MWLKCSTTEHVIQKNSSEFSEWWNNIWKSCQIIIHPRWFQWQVMTPFAKSTKKNDATVMKWRDLVCGNHVKWQCHYSVGSLSRQACCNRHNRLNKKEPPNEGWLWHMSWNLDSWRPTKRCITQGAFRNHGSILPDVSTRFVPGPCCHLLESLYRPEKHQKRTCNARCIGYLGNLWIDSFEKIGIFLIFSQLNDTTISLKGGPFCGPTSSLHQVPSKSHISERVTFNLGFLLTPSTIKLSKPDKHTYTYKKHIPTLCHISIYISTKVMLNKKILKQQASVRSFNHGIKPNWVSQLQTYHWAMVHIASPPTHRWNTWTSVF